MSLSRFVRTISTVAVLIPALVQAELPAAVPGVQFPARYVSLGDSLAAGFKAQPATEGFAYRLYLDEVFGSIPNTAFANLAVPGATSTDVLNYQVPQAKLLQPKAITLSVGGNDLLAVLEKGTPAPTVLENYGANLANILTGLCNNATMGEGGDIYINNLYTIAQYNDIFPGANELTQALNGVIDKVVTAVQSTCNNQAHSVSVHLADVYSMFQGKEEDALLINRYLRNGINFPDIHPTNKGYRLMELAYIKVIAPQAFKPYTHRHGRRHQRRYYWH